MRIHVTAIVDARNINVYVESKDVLIICTTQKMMTVYLFLFTVVLYGETIPTYST